MTKLQLDEIPTPRLVLDSPRLDRNIARMSAAAARPADSRLRHFGDARFPITSPMSGERSRIAGCE
jgi:hypothetical protein